MYMSTNNGDGFYYLKRCEYYNGLRSPVQLLLFHQLTYDTPIHNTLELWQTTTHAVPMLSRKRLKSSQVGFLEIGPGPLLLVGGSMEHKVCWVWMDPWMDGPMRGCKRGCLQP